MQNNLNYIEASFISFIIHGAMILYLLGFFYNGDKSSTIVSKPINVNLLFKEISTKSDIIDSREYLNLDQSKLKIQDKAILKNQNQNKNEISFDSSAQFSNIQELIQEDQDFLDESDNNIEIFSSLIISDIQSAWRKPINIQDNLICEMRLSINPNGKIVNVNLVKSSGNIRFDNSALKAVKSIETFNFYEKIPYSLYSSNFKSITITFNPK
tara:strand:+ start:68743 stop:69378 length:636 start_codon:yes stop_codon:yes gene_type:complete